MPELPEVETVRRSLLPIVGRSVTAVSVRERRLRRPVPDDLAAAVAGTRFAGFDRVSKYLLCRLSSGVTLLVHLGMSGTFFVRSAGTPGKAHDHVVFALDDGSELVFNDPRRFGVVRLGRGDDFAELARVGVDPLGAEFTAAALWALTRRRAKPVKNLLMDQTLLAGVGNIYANEALFRAGIRPRRAAQSLRRAEVGRLHACVRAVLAEAIELGGSSIADYRDGRGKPGYFQLRLQVYDRGGEPCVTCAGPIRRVVLGGRSTFYCPHCQR